MPPPDSDSMPLDSQRQRRKLSFDPTINAGHILTFISLVIAGFAAWSQIDKRLTVLERDAVHQMERDSAQDGVIREKFEQIKESLNELKQELRRAQR